jgi:hypothetical protein
MRVRREASVTRPARFRGLKTKPNSGSAARVVSRRRRRVRVWLVSEVGAAVTELDFRRLVPFAAAVAAAFSACTCSKSPASSSGRSSNGHVLDASGGTSPNAGSGGTGGGFATGATGGTSGVDSGPTGILPCASEPPSSVPVPSGWPAGAKRLPALDPDVYVFEVPPAGPLTWKACGTGCLELVNTWAPSVIDPMVTTAGWGAVINGTSWMIVERHYQNRIDMWVGPVDGAAVRTFIEERPRGTVPNGFSSAVGIDESGYVVEVGIHDSTAWQLGATLNGPLRCLFKEHVIKGQGLPQSFLGFATSDTRWALLNDAYGPHPTGELPLGSATAGVPELIDSPPGYAWDDSGIAGLPEGFIMTGYRPAPQLALLVWTPATGVVPFTASPGPTESDSAPASDGRTVVWLHGSGLRLSDAGVASWSNVELMRATDDGHFPVAGTVVGRLPTPYVWIKPLVYGDYVAGFVSPDPSVRPSPFALRLSDRRIWIIPNRGPDVWWDKVLYLSSDEVALTEQTDAEWDQTIVRYRLDSLGPGQPLDKVTDAGAP